MSTDENTFKRGAWTGDEWQPSDDDDDADGLPVRPHGTGLVEADLQLLELAAKAIGAVRIEVVDGEGWVNLHFADGSTVFGWNPLQFNGDTFELEVRLRLFEEDPDFLYKFAEEENLNPDRVIAARRAAVRAAAEIGRNQTS